MNQEASAKRLAQGFGHGKLEEQRRELWCIYEKKAGGVDQWPEENWMPTTAVDSEIASSGPGPYPTGSKSIAHLRKESGPSPRSDLHLRLLLCLPDRHRHRYPLTRWTVKCPMAGYLNQTSNQRMSRPLRCIVTPSMLKPIPLKVVREASQCSSIKLHLISKV